MKNPPERWRRDTMGWSTAEWAAIDAGPPAPRWIQAVGLPHLGVGWLEVSTPEDIAAGIRAYVPAD